MVFDCIIHISQLLLIRSDSNSAQKESIDLYGNLTKELPCVMMPQFCMSFFK